MAEIFIGLSGAVLGALITFLVAQRRLHSENVVRERSLWREKIRALGDQLASAQDDETNDQLRRQLALNLNITDLEDRKILKISRAYPRSKQEEDELTDRLSLLLKHDWERAKLESSWFPLRKADRLRLEHLTP